MERVHQIQGLLTSRGSGRRILSIVASRDNHQDAQRGQRIHRAVEGFGSRNSYTEAGKGRISKATVPRNAGTVAELQAI